MKVQIKRPKYEVAHVLNLHRSQIDRLIDNTWKQRILFALCRCRTPEMGGHIDQCSHPGCGKLHLSYNSCRNRHCPKCQGHLTEQWIEAREEELLNTPYFHVVFTLPDSLNEWVLSDPAFIYGLLFKTAWSVLKDFALDNKFIGGQAGMIAILHTWGQNLSLHPHLHCIVPGGALSKSGRWKQSKSKSKYLFPVKAMSGVFRARFLAHLRKKKALPQALGSQLFAKRWVIYCKQAFHGPRQVVEYLGRYTHKIAISNHRIKNIVNGKVYFTAKDYRKGGAKVNLVLSEQEFIRRFSLHILPKGFTRIRHYGILSSSLKTKLKIHIDDQLGKAEIRRTKSAVHGHRLCPSCSKGKLETVVVFDNRGPPPHWLERLAK